VQRVLIGTDGSVNGQVALRWAVDLVRATSSELVVAQAWRPPFSEVPPGTYEELRDDARRVLEDRLSGIARDADIAHRVLLLEGDPRALLLAAAADVQADLVVVGARGSSSHAHPLHLGSVTHHLVHHATLPLATIPAPARPSPPTRILVGVDGSPGSTRAVAWCSDIARGLAAEVIAVYAAPPVTAPARSPDPNGPGRSRDAECEEWTRGLREAGVATRSLVVEDQAVVALTESGVREQADLIVVGTRGTGGFSGLRLGSTALKVLHRSGLPVVLVPSTP
jgi:nucleotide-binding universal stress UspA family protein